MTRRRSLLWPTVFWLGIIAILCALGLWQIQRLHWKEALIAELNATMTNPPSALPAKATSLKELEFHHVKFTGVYLNKDELYRHAIAKDGKPGFHVVTPFKLTGGGILLVDRGFVPEDRRDPASRAAGQIEGETSVTGLLRLPEAGSWFTPANNPAKNLWFAMDLPAMAKADHLSGVMPFYIDADATPAPTGGLPLGGQTDAHLPNDHLQYALTWFGLAVVAAVYYVLIVLGLLKERRA